jgi:Fibronectin type III domain
MFALKTAVYRPRMSTPTPRYCATAAKVIALGTAVAMLSLPALGSVKRPTSTAPSTPENFHVTAVTTSSVTLAWDASSGASGYNIFNETTGESLNVGNVTSYVWDVGVQAGGTYTFYIEAYSGEFGTLVSAPSPDVTVTLAGTPLPTPVQPAAPVITQTSATSNTITVSWTESTPANEINDYIVVPNGYENGTASAPSPKTSATITGLTPSYTYTVTVIAHSLNGTTGALSTTSAPVTVTTAAATTSPAPASVLTAPTDLTCSAAPDEGLLSWNPSVSANEPQDDIRYDIYIDGVLDTPDSEVGQTQDVYFFPLGADFPLQVFVVAVDNLGNMSAPSNVCTVPAT